MLVINDKPLSINVTNSPAPIRRTTRFRIEYDQNLTTDELITLIVKEVKKNNLARKKNGVK